LLRGTGRVAKSKTEYLFKVNLKGAKRIWRTVVLRGDQTLDDLHELIFAAFDRYDEHLYSFYFPKARMAARSAHEQVREYTAPFVMEDPGPFDDGSRLDAAGSRLDDLGLRAGQRFEYLFDFGDSWWHEVTVEQIRPAAPGARGSWLVEKHGESPPQYPPAEDG
jgi:hypothetical protein